MEQTAFASLAFDAKKSRTRREKFPTEMEQVVPWAPDFDIGKSARQSPTRK